jgi:hypothetical protein
MSDERRPLGAGDPQEVVEPAGEGLRTEIVERLGCAEPRDVRYDDAVALGQAADDRRPVRAAALDAAVEQNERRPTAGLEHRRRAAAGAHARLGDGEPGQHPPARGDG